MVLMALLARADVPGVVGGPRAEIVGDELRMIYERPYPNPAGIQYFPEASDALSGWTSDGLSSQQVSVDAGVETVKVIDEVPVSEADPTRFLRLKVVESPVVAAVEIRPDGYTAEVTFDGQTPGGSYGLAPDTADPAMKLTVVSPGFDDTGAATTVQREVIGTVALRQPYPNNNLPTEVAVSGGVRVTVVLSDRIYAGDTVAHCSLLAGAYTSAATPTSAGAATVTNGSALAYPKAIGAWGEVQFERETGASHPVEFLAFHRYPRDGRQVACVEFVADDESGHSVSVKTSAMVASTKVTGGNPVALYRAEIPLGSLDQGERITVRAKAYPFLGDASAVLDSDPAAEGEEMPTPNLTNLIFLNDKTGGYGTAYAYVSPSGNDTTGVASADASAASASPCLTIQGATAKIQALNNASFGHNDVGGGVIRLTTGSHAGFGGAIKALPVGKTWLTVEGDPASSPSGIIFTTGSQKQPPTLVKFRNLVFQPTGTTAPDHILIDGVLDNATVSIPNVVGAWEGVEFRGDIAQGNPMIYRLGLRYFLNCRFRDIRTPLTSAYGNTCTNVALLAGCRMEKSTTTSSSWNPHNAVGNMLQDGSQLGEVTSAVTVIPADGSVIAYNSTFEQQGESGFGNGTASARGIALVQNLFERIDSDTQPLFTVGRDGTVVPLNNVVLQYNTTSGARTNFLYNDTGTTPIPKNGVILYSILQQFNIKTDTFNKPGEGPNGNRIGNWEPVHGVGIRDNVYRTASASGPPPPYYSSTSWNGSYTGRRVAIAVNPLFLNDQSFVGGNGGHGDYHVGAASPARHRVPSGLAGLPFDLAGTPRANDGTGAAGAYEYVSEP